jgi:hypothetical protein
MRAYVHTILLCIVLVFGSANLTRAATFVIDFQFQNFSAPSNPLAIPPTDPVSGSFTYQAASLGADIEAITGVSLTIAGHSYSLADVGFQSNNLIGGVLNGVSTITTGDDFFMQFSQDMAFFPAFIYSTSGTSNHFSSFAQDFSHFSITELTSPVPLPAALPLFASGLAGLGWLARRKKRMAA